MVMLLLVVIYIGSDLWFVVKVCGYVCSGGLLLCLWW